MKILNEEEIKSLDARCSKMFKGIRSNGEWTKEGNYEHFQHKGFDCMVLRMPSQGHLCGYVGLKKDHKFYNLHYDKIDVDVHGGLTYAEKGEDGNLSWIGFDCAHHNDYLPGSNFGILGGVNGQYRNKEFVTSELKKLVEQLVEPDHGSSK